MTSQLSMAVASTVTLRSLVAGTSVSTMAGLWGAVRQEGFLRLRFWASGHGILSLTVTGVLLVADLQRHAPAVACALFTDAGDSPDRAHRSVRSEWRGAGALRLA